MWQYEFWELLVIAMVFCLAGFVKGGIGLGLPTVSIGLMASWLPVEEAAGILIIPVILTNIWQAFFGTALRLIIKRLWTLQIALIIGSLLAAILIIGFDTVFAAALLGTMLAIFAILGLSGIQFQVSPKKEPILSPIIGFVTGLISGATAIFVIPVVPYLQAIDFGAKPNHRDKISDSNLKVPDEVLIKDALIQSLGITALVASIALAIGLRARGDLPVSVVLPGFIGTTTALIGMVLGRTVRNRMSLELFRRWVLIGLIGLGFSMILRSLIKI